MSNGFRTSAIRADLINKAEISKVSTWLQWVTGIIGGIFTLITILFWGQILYDVYPKSAIQFFMIFLGFAITLSFPLLTLIVGFLWARADVYNRGLDAVNLVGAIGGQLSMNSGHLVRGFFDAVDLGRELEVQTSQMADERIQQIELPEIPTVPDK